MDRKLQSRMFSRFDPRIEENKLFKGHLRRALELTTEKLGACIDTLSAWRLARTSSESDRIIARLETDTRLPQTDLVRVMAVLEFFLKHLMEDEYRDDSSGQWADDLLVTGQIDDNHRGVFVDTIERLRADVAPKVEHIVRQRRYSQGVLPGLKSCGTTVEMRAVQKNDYRWGTPVEEYRPTVVDVAGIVSVHIGLDAGTPGDFYFQGTENDLDLLISQFRAAKKELQALSDFVGRRNAVKDTKYDN